MSLIVSDAIARGQTIINSIDAARVEDSDWIQFFNNWLRYSRQNYNLPWARKVTPIKLFPGVIEYALPSDFAHVIAPQVPYPEDDTNNFLYTSETELAQNLTSRNTLSLAFKDGTQYLLCRKKNETVGESIIHDCESVTSNGTWVGSGTATNVRVDNDIFRYGSGSIAFDCSGSGTATLSNSTLTAVDLSDFEDKSYGFLQFFIPSGVSPTSITLKWGTDSSNYWSKTVTVQQNGAAFIADDWNLCSFQWFDATEVGTPSSSSIGYVEVECAGATAASLYRIDQISFKKFSLEDFNYYSSYLVQSSGGTRKESITLVDDVFLGVTEFEDCSIFYAASMIGTFILKDSDLASAARSEFERAFNALKIKYPDLSPSVQTEYYSGSLSRQF